MPIQRKIFYKVDEKWIFPNIFMKCFMKLALGWNQNQIVLVQENKSIFNSLWGRTESDTTEVTAAAAAAWTYMQEYVKILIQQYIKMLLHHDKAINRVKMREKKKHLWSPQSMQKNCLTKIQ